MSRSTTLHCPSLAVALVSLLFVAADWTGFRGPDARGVSEEAVPVRWGPEENVVWKTALPGFGASSPITLGERVFLTSYRGYGLDLDEPGQQADLQHVVLCVDLADGEIVWAKATEARLPETEYPAGFVKLHGYSSGTPVTDGERVYAFFGRSGVLAYSLDGRPLWQTSVGDGTHNWGSGTSPVLYENLVIVNASVESQAIVALDKTTGKEVWRVPGIQQSWSTPLVVDLPDGKKELVVSMKNKVLGIDPATGEQLWDCAGVRDYVVPAVIAHGGIVYVTGGRTTQTLAIRAGGRGDVSDTHLVWEIGEGSKVPTPVYDGGHLYWIDNRGFAACVNADTGEVVYKERLGLRGRGDKIYASLVLVGDKLYGVSREDGTVVLAAGPEFEQLAQNNLGDPSIFNATPVPNNGRLLIRSDRFLYCIGE